MNDSIVEAGNGTIRVSPLGATFEGDVPETEVERLLERAGSAGRSCMFIIGDAINYASGKWGEKYERWIGITGLEYGTLRNASYIAGKIQLSWRHDKLTYEHHRLVARLAPTDQERWLELADKEGFSTRRLRKSLFLGRPATDEDMGPKPDDRGIENVHPYVNRICGFWGKLKRARWVDSVDADQLETLARDLKPVTDIREELLRLAEERRAGRRR